MIKAQEDVLDVCDRMYTVATKGELAKDKVLQIEEMQESVAGQKMLVPIVGEFSSGKSTMINTILGESILPVDITPETSLATELHYTQGEEYAEGIFADGSSKRYEISKIKQLTNDADNYRSARVYLKNQQLQELEPLILVDMPGFSAPKEQHNKAISEYLNKGCYYIVLNKVTSGTISRSLLNRLREINSFGRNFSVFLSNSDVMQDSKVQEVKSVCEEVLEDEFGKKINVGVINNTDTESVKKCLSGIDENVLFKQLYFSAANEICNSLLEGLNVQIKAAKSKKSELESGIEEIKKSIEKIKSTSESDVQHMKSRYSGKMINDIISDVGEALEDSVDEIATALMSKSNVEHLLNEIVRSALVQSIQQRVGEVNDGIVADFSDSVKNLSEVFKNMDIDQNYSEKIVGTLQDSFKTLMTFLPTEKSKSALGSSLAGLGIGGTASLATALALPAVTTTVSTALGVAATAINPILGGLIVVLPTILGGLFGLIKQKSNNNNVKSKIISKLNGEVFPQIKSKLRTTLPEILQEQVGNMIEQVRSKYEQLLQSQQQELEKATQDKSKSEEEMQKNLQELEVLRNETQSIAQEIITWKVA